MESTSATAGPTKIETLAAACGRCLPRSEAPSSLAMARQTPGRSTLNLISKKKQNQLDRLQIRTCHALQSIHIHAALPLPVAPSLDQPRLPLARFTLQHDLERKWAHFPF
jgi:hypothetical protein